MLGKTVKKQRNAKGYTQKELADRIGVTHAAISKLEKKDVSSKLLLIVLGRELDSDFGLDWLKKHFEKYPELKKDKLEEALAVMIRRILKEDKDVMNKIYKEKKSNTKISSHQKKENP